MNSLKKLNGYQQQVSLYRNLYLTDSNERIRLCDVLEWIRHGNNGLSVFIDYMRRQSPEDMKILKRRLPAVTFNGVFSKRNGASMVSYSNITAIDLDHFGSYQDVVAYKNSLIGNAEYRFVVATFISPSGLGLKILCAHDNTDPGQHYNLYKQLERKFNVPQVDHGVFDTSRLTFLSYDPDIWINPDVIPFHYEYDQSIPAPAQKKVVSCNASKASYTFEHTSSEILANGIYQNELTDKRILNFMDKNVYCRFTDVYNQGSNRQLTLISYAKKLCEYGVLYENALKKLTYFFNVKAGLSEDEITARVAYAYASNSFGSGRDEIIEEVNKAKEREALWRLEHIK